MEGPPRWVTSARTVPTPAPAPARRIGVQRCAGPREEWPPSTLYIEPVDDIECAQPEGRPPRIGFKFTPKCFADLPPNFHPPKFQTCDFFLIHLKKSLLLRRSHMSFHKRSSHSPVCIIFYISLPHFNPPVWPRAVPNMGCPPLQLPFVQFTKDFGHPIALHRLPKTSH